jgi:hypothetical protein
MNKLKYVIFVLVVLIIFFAIIFPIFSIFVQCPTSSYQQYNLTLPLSITFYNSTDGSIIYPEKVYIYDENKRILDFLDNSSRYRTQYVFVGYEEKERTILMPIVVGTVIVVVPVKQVISEPKYEFKTILTNSYNSHFVFEPKTKLLITYIVENKEYFACHDVPFALSLTQEYYSLSICLGDRQ